MATATASVISRILGTSLMPNHTISSGTSAKFGTARSTSMFASTKFSPTRDSPATNASPSPSAIPNSSPYPTRSRLVNRCSCSDPSAIRRTAVLTTRVGGGTVRSSNTPVVDRICHKTDEQPPGRAVAAAERGTTLPAVALIDHRTRVDERNGAASPCGRDRVRPRTGEHRRHVRPAPK